MAISPLKHIVAMSFVFGWGHARPMLAFLAHLVKEHPVRVTFVLPVIVIDRAKQDLARYFGEDEEEVKNLIQFEVVPLELLAGLAELQFRFAYHTNRQFAHAYTRILADPELRHPDLFLCDVITSSTYSVVKELSRQHVPMIGFEAVAPTVDLPQLIGVSKEFSELGPAMDKQFEQVEKWAEEGNISFMAASNRIFDERLGDRIFDLPDLPPVAEHELYPQEPPYVLPWGLNMYAFKGMSQCEAIISPSAYAFERGTFDALAKYIAPRPLFPVGPLYPSGSTVLSGVAKEHELAQAASSRPIDLFLDGILEKKGPKSLLYISFGTTFSTAIGINAANVFAWVETVCDMGIPMLLVYSPTGIPFPEDLQAKIDATGISMVCAYAPQQFVLAHAATGRFLTHNGLSSTLESLSAGVPMISWPITGDQPGNALITSRVFKCSYELNEVRSGLGLKHRVSNGVTPTGTLDAVKKEAKEVLTKAFFNPEEREKMETGAQNAKVLLTSAWNDGSKGGAPVGHAKAALNRFIQTFLA